MMELIQIARNVYYIPSPANIGVVKNGKNAVLIDSGLDEDSGKKILRTLQSVGVWPEAIINTHSHADHCGGNRYIQEEAGAKVYAPEIEAGIIEYPYLEPMYLFSGASPLEELKNKFLMAPPSHVDFVIEKDAKNIEFDSVKLEIIRLPGHSPNQIGIEIDNVLFCADSVFADEILAKHKIPFFVNIDKEKETLAFLAKSSNGFYVPSHAEPCRNIVDLVKSNFDAIVRVEQYLLESFHQRKSKEEILKGLCDDHKIQLKETQQYYLMNTITMAYLSSMQKNGKLKSVLSDNRLFWEKASV